MSQPVVRRTRFPWLGLVIMMAGLALITVYMQRPALWTSAPLVKGLYLGLGGVLIVWGMWIMTSEIWPMGGMRRRKNGWRGYRVRMPREAAVFLVILIVLFLGALLGRSNMLVLVFALLAGPFVINGSITLGTLRGSKVVRKLPDQISAGEIFSVELVLSNSKRWMSSWMMEVHDSLRSRHEHLQPAVLFTRIPPRSSRSGTYQLKLAHRGEYMLGPLQVSSRFPLGLMERVIEVGLAERLVVFPQIGRLAPQWHRSLAYNQELVEQPRSRKGSFDDEFHQLREYRTGDNPRAIHWRTTARRNMLMVRDFHQNRDQDLLLAVDLWLPERPTPADLDRVELAVSLAATVCVEQCGHAGESRLWLGVAGLRVEHWTGQAGSEALDPLLELLALTRGSSRTDLPELMRRSTTEIDSACRRILITTRPEGNVLLQSVSTASTTGLVGDLHVVHADQETLREFFDRDGF